MKYSRRNAAEVGSANQYPLASMRPGQSGMWKKKGHLSIIFTTFLPAGSINSAHIFRKYYTGNHPERYLFSGPDDLKTDFIEIYG